MRYQGLTDFLTTGGKALAKGPVAMIFVEDLVEVESTIQHHQNAGFAQLLVFAPDALELPDAVEAKIHRIPYGLAREGALEHAVNKIIDAAPGTWLYYCYNAEYLFHPFCETRSIGELLAFHTEERRGGVLTYVVDLYADDLGQFPNAVALDHAYLDKSGYYALGRLDADGNPLDRQLDFFGGLRWRFEEHIPTARRKIDRISIFQAKKGLKLRTDRTFNDEEYNTYACPWHNNITVAIASFRTAKALKTNSGSTFEIPTFKWHNSTQFKWTSQQLLDFGLMEPGQWF
ncbi:glycosyltransferase family 2 protein [Aliiroseovarius sp. S1339]|uniref:glycosyltransferase family 2 protein n=1 Tax=Aliiroseovarius sp. S1339 TaxID=2936990 RepID=UPI0020C066B2|nr:glycosyltransferase family 2 protein [Aliiroseovarius sp. S1339]MCK8465378.1 glycosyltransferase family 2 protein [Aliiroseovarius sp. S1339]